MSSPRLFEGGIFEEFFEGPTFRGSFRGTLFEGPSFDSREFRGTFRGTRGKLEGLSRESPGGFTLFFEELTNSELSRGKHGFASPRVK